jgi:hypothetical protein
MSPTCIHHPPNRITDLLATKQKGTTVTCFPLLDIVPVDFTHRSSRFQALVFICRFSGAAENEQYTFRKCYARGCAHDLCPRVSQAVLIANRYLQRDYNRLEGAGIPIEKKLFTLEGSILRLMDFKEEPREAMVIDDYIQMAKEGSRVSIDVALEYVLATEHFEYRKNRQTFLLGDFTVTTPEKIVACQRCLGCYPTEREWEEKATQVEVANDRLRLLYREFDLSTIEYEKRFFE